MMLTALSLGVNERAHSVNKNENNHWTLLEQGALHILLSPAGFTVAFNTGDDRGEVPSQLGSRKRKADECSGGGEIERKRGEGEKRGHK